MAGFKRLGGFPALPAKKEGQSTTMTERPKNKASSTPSKLLELPLELRDKIFRYAIVSNAPIKLQFSSRWWPSRRRRFTMIPGLITASKQLRSETQRILFEANTFEITPEVWNQRSGAPVISLRALHHNLGLGLSAVSVCQEITVKINRFLFRLKGSFAVSADAEEGFTIAKQDYSCTHIGGPLPVAPQPGVCGCDIAAHVDVCNTSFRVNDIAQFFLELKERHSRRYGWYRSYHLRDLIRKDEVYAGGYCQICHWQGRRMIAF